MLDALKDSALSDVLKQVPHSAANSSPPLELSRPLHRSMPPADSTKLSLCFFQSQTVVSMKAGTAHSKII